MQTNPATQCLTIASLFITMVAYGCSSGVITDRTSGSVNAWRELSELCRVTGESLENQLGLDAPREIRWHHYRSGHSHWIYCFVNEPICDAPPLSGVFIRWAIARGFQVEGRLTEDFEEIVFAESIEVLRAEDTDWKNGVCRLRKSLADENGNTLSIKVIVFESGRYFCLMRF